MPGEIDNSPAKTSGPMPGLLSQVSWVHLACEIVVIAAVAAFFHMRAKNLSRKVDRLLMIVQDQEKRIDQMDVALRTILQNINPQVRNLVEKNISNLPPTQNLRAPPPQRQQFETQQPVEFERPIPPPVPTPAPAPPAPPRVNPMESMMSMLGPMVSSLVAGGMGGPEAQPASTESVPPVTNSHTTTRPNTARPNTSTTAVVEEEGDDDLDVTLEKELKDLQEEARVSTVDSVHVKQPVKGSSPSPIGSPSSPVIGSPVPAV